jgi:hypothetical protein
MTGVFVAPIVIIAVQNGATVQHACIRRKLCVSTAGNCESESRHRMIKS